MRLLLPLITTLIFLSCASPAQKNDNAMQEVLLLDKNDFNPYVEFFSTDIKDFFNPEQSGKYPSTNLFDGYFKTCWIAGSSDMSGRPALFVKVPGEIPVDKLILNIFSGYGKSKSLYQKNSRPKKIRVSLFAAFYPEGCSTETAVLYLIKKYPGPKLIELADTFGVQSFMLNIDKKAFSDFQKSSLKECSSFSGENYIRMKGDNDKPSFTPSLILKLETEEVYKGSKYDDVCISEIFFKITDFKLIFFNII